MPKQFHNEIMAKIWDHILFEGLTRKGEGEGGGRGREGEAEYILPWKIIIRIAISIGAKISENL